MNLYGSVFCGSCGQGLSFITRFRAHWEKCISLPKRIILKDFGAGAAFGGLLAFFAFSSMGMAPPTELRLDEGRRSGSLMETHNFSAQHAKKSYAALKSWFESVEASHEAQLSSLIINSNLILRNYAESDESLPNSARDITCFLPDNSSYKDEQKAGPVKRETAAIFIFRFIQDIFGLTHPIPSENTRADIPKYHFMNIPIETLTSLGIDISRTDEIFGFGDHLSNEDIFSLLSAVIKVGQEKRKQQSFASLEPQ